MRGMSLASERSTAVLDWNNNYGDDENKVILFHCGRSPKAMAGKGTLTSHKMFDKNDPGCGWGTNEGRIAPFDMTFSNCQTKDGKLFIYASEGKMTDLPIEPAYFGCAGVADIPNLQDKPDRVGERRVQAPHFHWGRPYEGHPQRSLHDLLALRMGGDRLMECVGGLDIGTTGAKIVVFSLQGDILRRFYAPYPSTRGNAGHELDARTLKETLLSLARQGSRGIPFLAGARNHLVWGILRLP